MSIRTKLFLGFLSIIGLFAIFGAYTYNLSRITEREALVIQSASVQTLDHAFPEWNDALHLRRSIEGMKSSLQEYALSQDNEALLKYAGFLIEFNESTKALHESALSGEQGTTNATLAATLESVVAKATQMRTKGSRVIEHVDAKRFEQATLLLGEINDLSESIAEELQVFEDDVQVDVINARATVGTSIDALVSESRQASLVLLGLLTASVAVAIIISYVLARNILDPLEHLRTTAVAIGQGHLDARVATPGKDEIGVLGTVVNRMASDLTQAFTERENSLLYLNAIIANLPDGLVVVDTQGRITHSNPALTELLALNPEALVGTPYQQRLDRSLTELLNLALRRPTEVFTAEMSLPGGRIAKAVASGITRDAGKIGQTLGATALVHDITYEKQVDRMKTDFISTVSHELRTPLTSVLGFARIIQKRLEDVLAPLLPSHDRKTQRALAQVRENTEIIISEGERLTALINDVLDISKMEAGKIDWHMERLDLREVAQRALAATGGLFQNRHVKLERDLPAELPAIVGDRDRLMQVVINLISNAVKFTSQGVVTCRIQANSLEVVVSVSDTGIGIAPLDQPKVFDKFRQVGDTLTDKPKGTGLGLPICKQIVEHHGGHIWLESQPGHGSTFFFSIPLAGPEPSAAPINTVDVSDLLAKLKAQVAVAAGTTAASTNTQKSVLVVDDDDNIRRLLRQELEPEGYQVYEACHGREALALLKQIRPNLILLDVLMPELDGYEVAAVVRHDPQLQNIPIILLSIMQDKERGYHLGIDRYLSKPIDVQALRGEINALIAQGLSHRKVLIVNEDTATVNLLTEVLQAQGFQVAAATNGVEGIEKALYERPGMVILNALVPDRQQLVQTLRFTKGMENVAFVVLE